MNEEERVLTAIQTHLIDTREQWWAGLSSDEREVMLECAATDIPALPDPAVQLIIRAKSPAALASYIVWEGQEGSWTLSDEGREFLLAQTPDT